MKTSEAQFREPQAKGQSPAKQAKRSFVSLRRKDEARQSAHGCSGWNHNEIAVQTNLYSSYVGTKPVDESDRTQVQTGWVTLCRTGAMGLQTLLHHAQEDTQCPIECAFVALQVVAQTLGHRQHPLAHWQAGKDVIGQMRCGLGHSPGVARGADATALAGEGDKKAVPAIVATHPCKAVGKDCALQVFAKS